MNEYIRLNRQSDAKASLDEFCYCVERASKEKMTWKFAIIAVHNALQGYLCIALNNGNGFETWSERHFKKWMKAYREGIDFPETRLGFFMDLYDKLFGGESQLNRGHIEWLNETRNSLVHFNTDSYGIHRESAILACTEALKAIEITRDKSLGLFFYSEEQRLHFDESMQNAKELIHAVK